MNKRQIGTKWEQLAKEYLEVNGYYILEMNYRCKIGEIDIIAVQDNVLVFIEVKYRSSNQYGTAIEAVNYRKQNIIRRVADYYLVTKMHKTDICCRFDVVGIDGTKVTLVRNAF